MQRLRSKIIWSTQTTVLKIKSINCERCRTIRVQKDERYLHDWNKQAEWINYRNDFSEVISVSINRRNKLKVEIKRISNSKFIEQEVQVQIRLASVWKIVQKTVRIASEYS